MAPRTTATFAKRQKERARQEKQQAKQQRRLQRRQEKRESPPEPDSGEFDSSTEVASHPEPLSDAAMAAGTSASIERELQ